MMLTNDTIRAGDIRQRGSVYVLVLGASILVAVIGVSALMAARVQHGAISRSADAAQTRLLARSAIDLGLCSIRQNPTWRTLFAAGTLPTGLELGSGTLTLTATDPVDGNLTNNNTDPVVLIGIGNVGQATYRLEVTLNGDGMIESGSWRRVVN